MTKSNLQYGVLCVLLLFALVAQISLSGFTVHIQAESNRYIQVPLVEANYGPQIAAVLPPYEKSGLKVGDEIVAFNDEVIDGETQVEQKWLEAHPGETLNVTVKRQVDGKPLTLTIPLKLLKYSSQTLGWTLIIMLLVVLPLSCLLLGFYIAFARPRDPLAWITLAMLASFSQIAGGGTTSVIASPWRELLFVYHPILNDSWPLWLVLFALYFPEPFAFVKRNPWLPWLLALPSVGLATIGIFGNFEKGHHIHEIAWLASFDKSSSTAITLLFTGYVFAFFTLLAFKRGVITAPDARRRLRLMMTGCSLSLTPILPVVLSQLGFLPRLPPWLVAVCLSMLLFFPITMAYVIVVQRAMDVRMVVRAGVQYAFAKTGVKILQIALVVLVVKQTIDFARQTNQKPLSLLIAAIGLILIFTLGQAAKRVRQWMDRRFFREAYNSEVILTQLSNSVAGIRDTRLLLETITKRIAESLHVPRIAVFLDRNGSYQPAYAFGFGNATPAVEFSHEAGTIRHLKRQQAPSRVYFDDPQSWVYGISEPEQQAFQSLNTQVLLPVTLKSRLLGLVSLGAKRSEEPYSKGDLQLLSAVASQAGLALENAELSESIRREVAQRERADRELEIAREVQQRLFPQKLPEVKGLDFAGYCRPALGVGGDYYDFIRLSDGCLGIAVGDVSGKGIAAALMMATLQASLRGQTIRPCGPLAEMIQHINRLVYEASADNRYATFFYAQYEPSTRELRYVNAGHNPPLVCRKNGDGYEFLSLSEGGTVVGLFPESPFLEARIQLEPGDTLVAFTDGISEAMNSADEEFGDDRLMAALRVSKARSAADLITYLLEKVDGFTAGAKQHDDMTLVVVRLQ